MGHAGYNDQEINITFRALIKQKMIEQTQIGGPVGESYIAFRLLEKGVEWILNNQSMIVQDKEQTKRGD